MMNGGTFDSGTRGGSERERRERWWLVLLSQTLKDHECGDHSLRQRASLRGEEQALSAEKALRRQGY